MAEDLSEYYHELGVKVRYLHADIKTLERAEIIRDLRLGRFDVLIGINLLREGLDLPEVTLVAILDADKEGYLRSHRSLIQTAGRAARNVRGRVLFYGDAVTNSMQQAINETGRRRAIQAAFNEAHGIVPMSIHKAVLKLDYAEAYAEPEQLTLAAESSAVYPEADEALEPQIRRLELEMKAAAKELEFERAAAIRNRIRALRLRELELKSGG
jgi:excinuclease ABC subunit B